MRTMLERLGPVLAPPCVQTVLKGCGQSEVLVFLWLRYSASRSDEKELRMSVLRCVEKPALTHMNMLWSTKHLTTMPCRTYEKYFEFRVGESPRSERHIIDTIKDECGFASYTGPITTQPWYNLQSSNSPLSVSLLPSDTTTGANHPSTICSSVSRPCIAR